MKVTGIAFIGIRTEQLEAMRHFFADLLNLDVTRREPDIAGFRLAGETSVEVFGPGDDFHAFFKEGPVVGFRVADFDEAYDELTEAGSVFIGTVQHESGISWNHFRGPDGNIYEIVGPGQPRDEHGVPVTRG